MSAPGKSLRLVTVEIRFEQDVVLARQRARELAQSLGFERQVQTSVATAVSEIARNAFRYAGGGRAEFSVANELDPANPGRPRQSLIVEIRDSGPGIAKLEDVLAGRYRSETGLGIGIVGTQRLMDRMDIASGPSGTTITLAKFLPPSKTPRGSRELQAIVDELAKHPPSGPLEELRVQNQELLAAMEEARKRQEELARVNQELADTNTGVLALYDELETLNRISAMLASKLELKPLIQSIIDVTTGLTGAEIGAFFLREENRRWRLYATSGAKAHVLSDFPAIVAENLFNGELNLGEIEHVHDLTTHDAPCVASKFAQLIANNFPLRSCLTVPVFDGLQAVIGTLLFAASKPNTFSERSERIIASVATQAAVGIDKAQLFETVASASEAKDQFFATLSHELRTPLNPALAIASSLQSDPRVPSELREDLAIIARNIRLEARLIDDLLNFNRLIKGKLELTTAVVDVHELITNVVGICREDLALKRQQLTTHFQATRSTVLGDAARLQQVLWNVLKNAIKFTPADGSIWIRTEQVGEKIRVEIADSGRGIDPDSVERIFSAFDQGKNHLGGHFGGLGLGLSIARMFVELHKGTITASSPGLEKGATIAIELALCVAVTEEIATPEIALLRPITTGHGRVLLVDDHPDTLHGVARLLRRRGFEVVGVDTAAKAVAEAEGGSFDLLISDLGLPDLSGLDLIAKIRLTQFLPAIALSGYGMEADLAESRKAGFQIHITKPVEFEELMDAVNTLLVAKSP